MYLFPIGQKEAGRILRVLLSEMYNESAATAKPSGHGCPHLNWKCWKDLGVGMQSNIFTLPGTKAAQLVLAVGRTQVCLPLPYNFFMLVIISLWVF